MKITDQTKWMRLKGCRKWCSNQKHGPFLECDLKHYPHEKEGYSKITFECYGKQSEVESFLSTLLGRRLERALEDWSKKDNRKSLSDNKLTYEIIKDATEEGKS